MNMWNELAEYLNNKNVLEIGCGIGQKTKNIINYANKVTAIDISENNIKIAKEQFIDNNNIQFLVKDASKLDFSNKKFDVVITTDSFHEIDPKIQDDVLNEMIRVADTIIFIEPDEASVTNELFKIFDPLENHSLRIKNSINKIFETMCKNHYTLNKHNNYNDVTNFKTTDEMYDTLLEWWSDIKIPTNSNEKKQMIDEIKKTLKEFDMLDRMEIFEKIHYYVFVKEV